MLGTFTLLPFTMMLSSSHLPIDANQPFPPRSGHTAAADSAGNVFLFGGYAEEPNSNKRSPLNDLWIFQEEKWTQIQPNKITQTRPGPRICAASAILGDEMFLFGGWDPDAQGTENEFLKDVWSLDLCNLHWTKLPDLPRGPVSRHVAVAFDRPEEPCIVIHTHRCIDSILVYDPALRKVVERETTGSSPSPRGLHAAAAIGNNFIIFGGAAKSGEMVDDTYALCTAGEEWMWRSLCADGPRPSARAGAAVAPCGSDAILLMCGAERANDSSLVPTSDAWLLALDRLECGSWSRMEYQGDGPPVARNAAILCAIHDHWVDKNRAGRLLLHGGWYPFVETRSDSILLTCAPRAGDSMSADGR